MLIFSLTEILPLFVGLHPKNIQALVEKPEDAADGSVVPEYRQSVCIVRISSMCNIAVFDDSAQFWAWLFV